VTRTQTYEENLYLTKSFLLNRQTGKLSQVHLVYLKLSWQNLTLDSSSRIYMKIIQKQ